MFPKVPKDIVWLEPWKEALGSTPDDATAQELRREVGTKHALYGSAVLCVGYRVDCDDVLFVTDNPTKPLAVVHLTYTKNPPEHDPRWPHTEIYEGWKDWRYRCLIPDNLNYAGEYLFEVKESFMIDNRGLIVVGDRMDSECSRLFRVGSELMLLRPGMPPLTTKIKGLEMFSPHRPDNPPAVQLEGNLDKSDVPIGTEVWLVDAKPRS